MKLYGAITGLTQDIMKEYQQNLAPGYQRNSQLLAITKAVKGKFKMVDLSTVLPYDYVRRPWEAMNNLLIQKRLNNEDVGDVAWKFFTDEGGPIREFFDPYITTPIGLEAVQDSVRGYTKTGKKIFSELDDDGTKAEKRWEHLYKALEPGAVTTLKQLYSAYTGTPYKGRVYDEQDVLMGLATGIKPYDVDVNKTVDFLISDYTKIRSKAFDASVMYKTETNNGNDEITDDFIRIQRNIWREQRRIYQAFKTAQKFGVDYYTLRKELRARGISLRDVRGILNGTMDPIPFSETRFKNKLKELEEMNREFNKGKKRKRRLNTYSFYPKYELRDILRNLKYQRLDEDFFYDKIQAPTIPINIQTSMVPNKIPMARSTNIQTPPLPGTPMPDQKLVASMPQINQQTGLTRTESALLSPSEQVIARRT